MSFSTITYNYFHIHFPFMNNHSNSSNKIIMHMHRSHVNHFCYIIITIAKSIYYTVKFFGK